MSRLVLTIEDFSAATSVRQKACFSLIPKSRCAAVGVNIVLPADGRNEFSPTRLQHLAHVPHQNQSKEAVDFWATMMHLRTPFAEL